RVAGTAEPSASSSGNWAWRAAVGRPETEAAHWHFRACIPDALHGVWFLSRTAEFSAKTVPEDWRSCEWEPSPAAVVGRPGPDSSVADSREGRRTPAARLAPSEHSAMPPAPDEVHRAGAASR